MEKRKQPPTPEHTNYKRLRPQLQQDTHPHFQHGFSTAHSFHASHLFTSWLPLIARPQDTYRAAPSTAFASTVPNTMTRLQGHTDAVHTCAFSPSGRNIASAGADKSIYLWSTNGSGDHYGIIRGRHLGAILDIHWSRTENLLVTACADGTCGAFDAQTGERISAFKGHTASVTCCTPMRTGPELTASGSIDGSVKIWDRRAPGIAENAAPLHHRYPVSSVAFSDNNDILFSGGSGHKITAWDRRAMRVLYTLSGHMDAITGIQLSPDGTRLLSTSMDNTARIWNLGPYSDPSRQLQQVLKGVGQGMDEHEHQSRPAWSSDGLLVGSGTGDGNVTIWDARTGQVMQTLSDHLACVSQVDFHPGEHTVVSSSADKSLALRSLRHLYDRNES